MKNFKILILSLLFLAFLLGFQNCQKNDSTSCNGVKIQQDVKIDLNSLKFMLTTKVWSDKTISDFDIMSAKLDGATIAQVRNLLINKADLDLDADIQGMVFYLNSSENTNFNKIILDNISGIGIYELKGDALYHRLFLNSKSGFFNPANELDGYTSGYVHNYIQDIANVILPKSCISKGYIIVNNKNSQLQKKLNSFEQLPRLITKYRQRYGDVYLRDAPVKKCAGPCPTPTKNSHCEHDPWWDLDECVEGCKDTEIHDLSGASESVRNTNFNLHYQFRDEFLLNSNFGQTYLGYYATLSQDFSANLTPSFAIEVIDFFQILNPSLQAVLDPNAYQSSYILVTPQIYTKAKSIINEYKKLTSDPNVLNAFIHVEQDLAKYLNKPASIVLNDCCL